MTLGHFIYIPGILLLGVVLGYVLGGRAAAVGAEDAEARDRRRAARDARRQARAAETSSKGD
jgi:hypothetical protein